MVDLKFVLQNRDLVAENCRLRNVRVNLNLIEQLARQRAQLIQEVEKDRTGMNKIAKQVKKVENDEERKKLIEEGKNLRAHLKDNEAKLREVELLLKEELHKVPNLTHPEAPVGQTEQDNIEVKRVGKVRSFPFQPRNHVKLGRLLDIIDFEGGTKVAGPKFYYLKNEGVLLELALIQYVVEVLNENGFRLFSTPDIAKLSIIEGIGFIPRGPETQIYRIEESNLGLIATAEITLGGLFQDSIIEAEQLPLKLGGISHCFRTEAGTYGKASRGLYRVHQFSKVEMFICSLPEDSDRMLSYLIEIEEKIFSDLGIPFRVVDCCTGDLGGAAYRKFDLEAWMPGENRWGEITSASNCTDYQARRLNIKFKRKTQRKAEFIHTLNGTAVAVSRTLIAILENFQKADGSVAIPKVLQKFIGKEKIIPRIQKNKY